MGTRAARSPASSTVTRLQAVVDVGSRGPRPAIEDALELAVADIADHPETTDEGTGTTLTGVFLELDDEEPHWVALNIGDSRVYLLRDDRLVQVTTDHSVVQELIAAGKLSPEEAEGHPYSNVITRAVGASELTPPDYVTIDVRAGRPLRDLLGRAHQRAHGLRHPALPARERRPRGPLSMRCWRPRSRTAAATT